MFHFNLTAKNPPSFLIPGCCRASHLSFQPFALQRAFSETFTEEVLAAISSSVTPVAGDWNDHFLVKLVVREKLLKSVAQGEKVLVLANSTLKNARLYLELLATLLNQTALSSVRHRLLFEVGRTSLKDSAKALSNSSKVCFRST